MSLENLSPTAIKIGLAAPFVVLAIGVYMAIHGIPLPSGQLVDELIGTIAVSYGGITIIRRMNRRKRILWLVFIGYMIAHFSIWGILWNRTSGLGGIYFLGASIAELYLLGFLLTWIAIRQKAVRPHARQRGPEHG